MPPWRHVTGKHTFSRMIEGHIGLLTSAKGYTVRRYNKNLKCHMSNTRGQLDATEVGTGTSWPGSRACGQGIDIEDDCERTRPHFGSLQLDAQGKRAWPKSPQTTAAPARAADTACSKKFLKECRLPFDEAVKVARSKPDTMTVNGKSWLDFKGGLRRQPHTWPCSSRSRLMVSSPPMIATTTLPSAGVIERVHDQLIPIRNAGAIHGMPGDTDQERARDVPDKVPVQVDPAGEVVLGG